jgi:hypothetical protein
LRIETLRPLVPRVCDVLLDRPKRPLLLGAGVLPPPNRALVPAERREEL